MKTWAPIGQTPVLQCRFNWKQLSLIAGVTYWNFYFRFFPGAIKSPRIVAFLQALARQVRGDALDHLGSVGCLPMRRS